jgi:hypothetical protein
MAQQIQKKFIEDGAVDGDKLRLLIGQALVQETADGVVELIKQQSSDGAILINGKEAGYKEDLDQEIADRTAADSTLQANIDAEAETRNLVDQQLADDIVAEASARSSADTTLQSNIDAEASTRAAADTTLQGNIDTEVADRTAADSTLQSNIDAEASARAAADVVLQGNIDTEAADRAAADTTLQSNIDAEASARSSADTALQNQINDILSNTDPAALDSLSEIVSAFQAADGNLQDAITAALGTHTSELAVEVAAREAADTVLQGNIDAEESARISDVSSLQSQINTLGSGSGDIQGELDDTQAGAGLASDGSYSAPGVSNYLSGATSLYSADEELDTALKAEEDARSAADVTLQSNIDSEASTRDAADVVLQANIDSEASTRSAADTTLQSNIDAEASARDAADVVLQGNIDAEESARIAADSVLQSNIDAEESARIAADSNLQSQINDILSNTDPAALDSLSEIVAAFQSADSDLTASITSVLGTHTSELAAETSARQSADSALSGRVDILEARAFKKEVFTLDATDISNGYVDLGFEARPNSIVAFVGRLAMHEGASADYSVSVVGGVSRVTFLNDMVSPSEEALEAGDVLNFTYEAN